MEKKNGIKPELEILEIKDTASNPNGGYWEFVQDGEFWKRSFNPGSLES
ncbi:hypothetical protein AB6A23_13870 [Paenibacillus tarimensis]